MQGGMASGSLIDRTRWNGSWRASALLNDPKETRPLDVRIELARAAEDGGTLSGDFWKHADVPVFDHSFRTDTLIEARAEVDAADFGLEPALFTGKRGLLLVGIGMTSLHAQCELLLWLPAAGKPRLWLRRYGAGPVGRIVSLAAELDRAGPFYRRLDLTVAYAPGLAPLGVFKPEALEPAATVEHHFARAGIDLRVKLQAEPIDQGLGNSFNLPGEDQDVWNDAELHQALDECGTQRDTTPFGAGLLVLPRYVRPGVLGIMFDGAIGPPRQGAAIFTDAIARSEAEYASEKLDADLRLFTAIHELGHVFNLLHSFDDDRSTLYRRRARPESLSWMNYPNLYPGFGNLAEPVARTRFWRRFAERFAPEELAHLRHGALWDVLPGGTIEALMSRPADEAAFVPPTAGPLSISLVLPPTIAYREWQRGTLVLVNQGASSLPVHDHLDLSHPALKLVIQREQGPALAYRAHASGCTGGHCGSASVIRENLPAGSRKEVPISPWFGDRWYVQEPGTYTFQAIYTPPGGAAVASSPIKLVVLAPTGPLPKGSESAFFSPAVGLFMALGGSPAAGFATARETLARQAVDEPSDPAAITASGFLARARLRRLKRLGAPPLFDPESAIAAARDLANALPPGHQDELVRGATKAMARVAWDAHRRSDRQRAREAVSVALALRRRGPEPQADHNLPSASD